MSGRTTLATLNIGGPSAARAERLAEYLLGLDLDAAVLTETRPTEGTRRLLDAFAASGYTIEAAACPDQSERGVAVAHRTSRCQPPKDGAGAGSSHRLTTVRLSAAAGAADLVAAYVPSRDATAAKIARKRRFLEQMTTTLEHRARAGPVILMGDLNIVGRGHQPRLGGFRAWEYDAFDRIAGCGLIDVFAALHPGAEAHSWIGRSGLGYRYDYAFASAAVMDRTTGCEYLHEPRERSLTDHAAVVMTIAGGDDQSSDDQSSDG